MEGRLANPGIQIKTSAEVEGMRVAGRLASEVLDFIAPQVKPGVTTGHLDKLCHDYMTQVQGTIPAPLDYAPPGHRPYPKSICTSVNHQVCHGVPGDKLLRAGDIVNIDITVIKDGCTATAAACSTWASPPCRRSACARPRTSACGRASRWFARA